MRINLRDRLVPFYIKSLEELCKPGEDPSVYGETVYCDADLIQFINERVNLGRYVANIKIRDNPSLDFVIEDANQLKEKLTDLGREEEVIRKFRELAGQEGLNQSFSEKYARWIIEETIGIEVKYLQGLVKKFRKKGLQIYRDSLKMSGDAENKNTVSDS